MILLQRRGMFYDGGGARTAVFVVFFFVFFFSSSALFLLNKAEGKADAARGGCVVLSPKTITLVDNINKKQTITRFSWTRRAFGSTTATPRTRWLFTKRLND
jgi:hypothetical protein